MVATDNATETPQGTTVDWDELRALHVKGVSLKDLSDRYNVSYTALRSRSSREKWCNTVATARQLVTQAATEELSASAHAWIGKIDTAVHAGLDNVLAKGLKKLGLRDLQIALDCAEKANRIARLNYGLDANNAASPRVTVNVAVCDQQRNRLGVALKEYVDVETVDTVTDAQT